MRWKFFLVIATAMLGASCSTASTKAFDDPAVAACEFTLIKGRYIPAPAYERINAMISGTTVTIRYRTSVLNTAPRERELVCHFALDTAGRFGLVAPVDAAAQACGENLPALIERAKKAVRNSSEYHAVKSEMERCLPIMKADAANQANYLREVALPLTQSGIYPVAPEDTALRATN